MALTELENPSILIISYYFPPFKRVGGRRWAKHTKYLNRFGLKIFVLCGEFLNSTSAWDEDIEEYAYNIRRVNLGEKSAPFFKSTLPNSLYQKIKWKLSFYFWKVRYLFFKGNYNDVSINSSNAFLLGASELIEEKNVNTVIISVGPFRYSEIIIPLKEKFPEVKFVIDYRDRWEDCYAGLTGRQIKFEEKKQKKILNVVDFALTVNDNISGHLRNINPNLSIYTLPHCVDDDFYELSLSSNIKEANMKERFIYGGELYNGMTREIKTFISFFEMYKAKSENILEACFYVSYSAYEDLLKTAGVKVESLLPKKQFQNELIQSDFIVLFRPEWSPEAFSSKFFEILCLRKPILYFGEKGKVSEFLASNRLGFHVENENIHEVLTALLENSKHKKIPNLNFDLSNYTFEHHSKLLKDYIEKINLPELNASY